MKKILLALIPIFAFTAFVNAQLEEFHYKENPKSIYILDRGCTFENLSDNSDFFFNTVRIDTVEDDSLTIFYQAVHPVDSLPGELEKAPKLFFNRMGEFLGDIGSEDSIVQIYSPDIYLVTYAGKKVYLTAIVSKEGFDRYSRNGPAMTARACTHILTRCAKKYFSSY